jgi:hypothetical protein
MLSGLVRAGQPTKELEMKLFRGSALLCALGLCTTAAFAKPAGSVQISAPAPSGGSRVCVDVYCNGSYAGQSCGATTDALVNGALALCGAS